MIQEVLFHEWLNPERSVALLRIQPKRGECGEAPALRSSDSLRLSFQCGSSGVLSGVSVYACNTVGPCVELVEHLQCEAGTVSPRRTRRRQPQSPPHGLLATNSPSFRTSQTLKLSPSAGSPRGSARNGGNDAWEKLIFIKAISFGGDDNNTPAAVVTVLPDTEYLLLIFISRHSLAQPRQRPHALPAHPHELAIALSEVVTHDSDSTARSRSPPHTTTKAVKHADTAATTNTALKRYPSAAAQECAALLQRRALVRAEREQLAQLIREGDALLMQYYGITSEDYSNNNGAHRPRADNNPTTGSPFSRTHSELIALDEREQ